MNRQEIYWKGDRATLTGKSETMHGGLFYEAEIVEGFRKGDRVWIAENAVKLQGVDFERQ